MVLLVHVRGKGITVKCLVDQDGDKKESTAEQALHLIQLRADALNEDQLALFDREGWV